MSSTYKCWKTPPYYIDSDGYAWILSMCSGGVTRVTQYWGSPNPPTPDRTNGPGYYTDHVHPQYCAHCNKSRRTDLGGRIAMLVRIASKDSNAVMLVRIVMQ